ncbi:hypothetical protein B0T19DRAFT_249941 [Cercophora scortea]|uniref:Uncharacterized protein n=1 Tax=Cercophora scortea TaxID=314031 RepID=A0AAE0I989_9PEZI|nr:hypothetical protein B0T19DRAFT_249941 [Cercophora scortea]
MELSAHLRVLGDPRAASFRFFSFLFPFVTLFPCPARWVTKCFPRPSAHADTLGTGDIVVQPLCSSSNRWRTPVRGPANRDASVASQATDTVSRVRGRVSGETAIQSSPLLGASGVVVFVHQWTSPSSCRRGLSLNNSTCPSKLSLRYEERRRDFITQVRIGNSRSRFSGKDFWSCCSDPSPLQLASRYMYTCVRCVSSKLKKMGPCMMARPLCAACHGKIQSRREFVHYREPLKHSNL